MGNTNISPIFVILGIVSFYLLTLIHSKKTKYGFLILSFIFLSLAAYGYVASWIYLPFFIITLAITSILRKWLSTKGVIIWMALIFALVLPLVMFAYRVNVQHIDKFSKFLSFDLPYLQANRVSSLISFKGSLFNNISTNIFAGIKQALLGSDNLPQNSSLPYGAVLPFMIIFAVIGILAKKNLFTKNEVNFRIIILEALLAFLPETMVIRPNYNHWNFIWFPIAILAGYGLYISFNAAGKFGKIIIILLPVTIFCTFTFNTYFGFENQKTVFNASSGSYKDTQRINTIVKAHNGSNLYIEDLAGNFPIFRLVQSPINDTQYLKVQGKKRMPSKIISAPTTRYGYLRDVNDIVKSQKGDLAMVYEQNLGIYGNSVLNKSRWKIVKNTYFNHYKVKIFQKI